MKVCSAVQPYPGTRPFEGANRNWFFGRGTEAEHLAELWRTNSLVIMHGRAGCGKTSLLRAGVAPQVEGGPVDVLPVGGLCYGATFPAAALPGHNPYQLALLRSWQPDEVPSRLAGLSVREFLARRAGRSEGPVLAAIDQAEELFAASGARQTHRQRLLAELRDALAETPQLHLLLVVREDSASEFAAALDRSTSFEVTALSPAAACEAVSAPLRETGRSFAAGAAEELVEDLLTSRTVAADGRERLVRDDLAEPALLQVVCTHLWRSLPADRVVITARDVRKYGAADMALAVHCGRALAAVAEDHGLPTAQLRSWLLRTFITEFGTRRDAYEGMTNTAGMASPVAQALEDQHLLYADRRRGLRHYELLSDRLVEPLRNAAEEPLPLVTPGENLAKAGRALTLGDLGLAEQYASEVLRTAPSTDLRIRAEAHSLFGNVWHERGQPAEAEACYRAAARLYEVVRDTAAVASQLAAAGQSLLAQGEVAAAVRELQASVDRMPNDLVVQTQLGWALWQLGQGRTAVSVLTGVLSIDSGHPAALQARGEILADLGDPRAALRDLDRVELGGGPSTYAARGLALAECGEYGAASREFKTALADDGRWNGPALIYAARADALAGRQAEAAKLASQALNAVDPALPAHLRAAAEQIIGSVPARDS